MKNTVTQQLQIVSQATPDPTIHIQPVAFFDENGDPVVITEADNVLTGYVKGTAAPVSGTDTVSEAIGKVEAQVDDVDEKASAPGDQAGTGYVIDGTGGALAATDTLLEMIGKLEKRVVDLEGA